MMEERFVLRSREGEYVGRSDLVQGNGNMTTDKAKAHQYTREEAEKLLAWGTRFRHYRMEPA